MTVFTAIAMGNASAAAYSLILGSYLMRLQLGVCLWPVSSRVLLRSPIRALKIVPYANQIYFAYLVQPTTTYSQIYCAI